MTIHDPKAIKNTMKVFGEKINYAKTIHDSLKKSHCVIIMTQWKEYENLNNNSIKYMSKKLIIDCRRTLVKKELAFIEIMAKIIFIQKLYFND